ncbi:MAG TPA: esterase family protein, partial [Mycobacterium sp.]|nr:esterase family protein [Mycobacterium sp.]
MSASLMHGWIPVSAQATAAVVVAVAVGWRSPRWRRRSLPVAVAVGAAAAFAGYAFITVNGLADDPAPAALWLWVTLTGFAATVAVLGWPGARWWRRTLALLAVPLCLLCALLALNGWVGYFPTVSNAWNALTFGPLPHQADLGAVTAMADAGAVPPQGRIVPVTI